MPGGDSVPTWTEDWKHVMNLGRVPNAGELRHIDYWARQEKVEKKRSGAERRENISHIRIVGEDPEDHRPLRQREGYREARAKVEPYIQQRLQARPDTRPPLHKPVGKQSNYK